MSIRQSTPFVPFYQSEPGLLDKIEQIVETRRPTAAEILSWTYGKPCRHAKPNEFAAYIPGTIIMREHEIVIVGEIPTFPMLGPGTRQLTCREEAGLLGALAAHGLKKALQNNDPCALI